VAPAALALVLAAGVAPASADTPVRKQQVAIRLSQAGLDFAAQTLPTLLPSTLMVPALDKSLYSCAAGKDVVAHVSNGMVNLMPGAISLKLYSGEVAGSLGLSLNGSVHVKVDNLDSCNAPIECDIGVTVTDLDLETVLKGQAMNGILMMSVPTLMVNITPDQIAIDVSACAQAAMLTQFLNAAKNLLLDHATSLIEDFAKTALPPLVAIKLGELAHKDGTILGFDYSVAFDDVTISPQGFDLTLGVGFGYSGPPAACNGPDAMPAAPVAGDPLVLDLGPTSPLVLALSTGLAQEALGAVWQSGLICIDTAKLAAVGLDLSSLDLSGLVPGIAPGTSIGVSVTASQPPTLVTGETDSLGQVQLGLKLQGLTAKLTLTPPGGQPAEIDISADGTLTGLLDLDPTAGDLGLTVQDLSVDRLDLSSSQGAMLSIDRGRLQQILKEVVLPLLASKLGRIPLTAASLDLAGFVVSVDQITSRPEGVYVGLSVFKPPANDTIPPQLTTFQTPGPLVRAGVVPIEVAATDDQTPQNFARFSYQLDGAPETDPSYSRQIRLNVTQGGQHTVQVWAHDLSNNKSPSMTYNFEVDAAAPMLSFTQAPGALVNQSVAMIGFTATDDRTMPAKLTYAIDVFVSLPGKDRAPLLHKDFAPYAPLVLTQLQEGGVYEVQVTAQDEAGNTSSASTSFAVQLGGGCTVVRSSTAAASPLAGLFLLLLAAGLVVRRRAAR
jgi:hypothetical protein